MPNALAFAVLAGFADVIPLIGALIAIVPPVAAALQESSTHALVVLVALVAYQQFEDRVLVPRVYGRTLNLPPVIVLIAVLAGAELLGITGVLLALPLTAAGRVGLDYLMQNRELLLGPNPGEQVLAPDEPPPGPALTGEKSHTKSLLIRRLNPGAEGARHAAGSGRPLCHRGLRVLRPWPALPPAARDAR